VHSFPALNCEKLISQSASTISTDPRASQRTTNVSQGRKDASTPCEVRFLMLLLLFLAWFAWLGSDKVGDFWRASYDELMNRVLQDAVGIGDTLVLTQMLKP